MRPRAALEGLAARGIEETPPRTATKPQCRRRVTKPAAMVKGEEQKQLTSRQAAR